MRPTAPGCATWSTRPATRRSIEPMSDAIFTLPEELEQFRKLVREIAEERIEPRAAEIDATDEFPHDVHELLVENELMAVGYPEELGGAGGGSLTVAVMIEEISRVSAGVAIIPPVARIGAVPGVIGRLAEQNRV